MKIAVMGTGGVGGYYGGRLAAAGEDVRFIARGAHLDAMRERGLQVFSGAGDLQLKVKATDDPGDIGPVDIVLFCVKLYDLESAAAAIHPLIGPDTAVISLQNGVDSETRLARLIDERHIVGGAAYISAAIESPGVIRHVGKGAFLVFGELDGQKSPRLEALLAACKRAGFGVELSTDIYRVIWEKFTLLASLAGVTTVAGATIGQVIGDGDLRGILEAAMREVMAIAESSGIVLPIDLIQKNMAVLGKMPPGDKTSMARDHELGHRLEIESLSGAVTRLGAACGVSVPIHRTIYAALKLDAGGRR